MTNLSSTVLFLQKATSLPVKSQNDPDSFSLADSANMTIPATDSWTVVGAWRFFEFPMSVATQPGWTDSILTLGNAAAWHLVSMLTAALEHWYDVVEYLKNNWEHSNGHHFGYTFVFGG